MSNEAAWDPAADAVTAGCAFALELEDLELEEAKVLWVDTWRFAGEERLNMDLLVAAARVQTLLVCSRLSPEVAGYALGLRCGSMDGEVLTLKRSGFAALAQAGLAAVDAERRRFALIQPPRVQRQQEFTRRASRLALVAGLSAVCALAACAVTQAAQIDSQAALLDKFERYVPALRSLLDRGEPARVRDCIYSRTTTLDGGRKNTHVQLRDCTISDGGGPILSYGVGGMFSLGETPVFSASAAVRGSSPIACSAVPRGCSQERVGAEPGNPEMITDNSCVFFVSCDLPTTDHVDIDLDYSVGVGEIRILTYNPDEVPGLVAAGSPARICVPGRQYQLDDARTGRLPQQPDSEGCVSFNAERKMLFLLDPKP